jgi:hypothetical protein
MFQIVQEFAAFEQSRHRLQPLSKPKAPDLESRQKAWDNMQKYFGKAHYEKDYKEELNEALDEKYHRFS